MRINKEKSIGRVLFIVEGGRTEFVLLRRIFCNVLAYEYIEKRRAKATYFQSRNISTSRVAVINTEESNISFIKDKNQYLENIFSTLITDYRFPVDKAAIYYLFDRDPKSNLDNGLLKQLISTLVDPYDNDDFRAGLLLLSYPSIESYNISSFKIDAYTMEFGLGREAKEYISLNKHIQVNKINEHTIKAAANELIKYLVCEEIEFDIDNISEINKRVFEQQERHYKIKSKYKVLSMLSVAFIQLGIIDID